MSFELRKYREPDFDREPFLSAPDAVLVEAPRDGVAPVGFHGMSIFPEYFKINGTWLMARESRMDCVAVYDKGVMQIVEPRRLRKGDLVVVGRTEDGSKGIYLNTDGFREEESKKELFAFRGVRSRETGFSRDYRELGELLRHERDHGKIVWVAGPALTFDKATRTAFAKMVDAGYVHALMAGNAMATHDLEAAWLGSTLGQDIETLEQRPLGHHNHLDTINCVRSYGSIPAFLEGEKLSDGIIAACVRNQVPFVLCGSIRDDGPLPEVIPNVYEAQNVMRNQIRGATTVICMATMLHSIATGNMTPSFRVMPDGTVRQIYFYCVDVAEFATNKLSDRGSLTARGIVTNVQDFVQNVSKQLGL